MSRRKNRVGVFDRAIALFAALLVFGGFAFFVWNSTQTKEPEKRETVEAFDAKEIATIAATTVTEDQIKQQKNKILKKDKDKKLKEKQRQAQEKKKLDDLKKKQKQEKKKLDDIKNKQAKAKEAEVKEKAAIALRKKKEKADETKRKADERKRKEKEDADKKRKLAEQEKRDEAEKKQEVLKAAKKSRQDDIQAEIAAEREADQQRALKEESAKSSTTLRNRYSSLIQQKIQSNFVTPLGASAKQVPVVNIQLDESGNVLSSRIVTSSGDFSYDQAALSAVWKSSPLPLPIDDPIVRKQFQDFDLRVRFN